MDEFVSHNLESVPGSDPQFSLRWECLLFYWEGGAWKKNFNYLGQRGKSQKWCGTGALTCCMGNCTAAVSAKLLEVLFTYFVVNAP